MGDFSENIVNQRFNKVYQYLEDARMIKGKSDIAKKLGTYNHVINSILKGQRNITVDQLHRLFEHYRVNANFLFGLSDDLFLEGAANMEEIPVRSFNERRKNSGSNITLVPDPAVAGYAMEHQDRDWLNSFQKFSVPGVEGSNLVAFEISGDSMMPTITNGDLVICEAIDDGSALRDNHVYVVVTDVVVAKRIQQLRDRNALRLISDNHAVYQAYDVELNEVRQILKVKCRLTNHAIS